MLNTERGLHEEFCAETSSGDQQIVDPRDHERTVRYIVPGTRLILLYTVKRKMKRFSVYVNGIIRLAYAIAELAL